MSDPSDNKVHGDVAIEMVAPTTQAQPSKSKSSLQADEALFATSQLETRAPCKPVVMKFKNINYTVTLKNTKAAPRGEKGGSDAPVATKQILFDMNGAFASGELVAVIGASGAGKTSLLDVLSGRRVPDAGSVYLQNGQTVDRELLKSSTAYVPQDDLFLPNITVREHLMFAAQLRLPRSMSMAKKKARVNEILEKLGLSHVGDSVIGQRTGAVGQRGISGGEAKRLSYAAAVLTQPSALFIDEPTSGLDSFMAEAVVRQLRDLARSGRAILTVIHQPSAAVFNQFTKVIFLTQGRIAYSGPRANVVAYFSRLGYTCPRFVCPAEYAIKLMAKIPNDPNGDARARELTAAWSKYLKQLEDVQAEESKEAADVDATGSAAGFAQCMSPKVLPPAVDGGESKADADDDDAPAAAAAAAADPGLEYMQDIEEEERLGRVPGSADIIKTYRPSDDDTTLTAGYANTMLQEMVILTRRGFINTIRDPVTTRARIMQTIVLSVLLMLTYWRLGEDQQAVQDRLGLTYFVIINQSMLGVFGVLQTFPLERPAFLMEHEAGMYRSFSYFISKMLGDLPNQIVFPTVFISIVYWACNIRDDFQVFLIFLGVALATTNAAMSLGYLISTAVTNVAVALAVGPVSILPLMLFGGFFLNTDSIPVYLVWLEHLSFFKYGYLAIGYNVFEGREISCDDPTGDKCQFANGDEVVDFYRFEENVGLYVVYLCILIVGLRILSYLALWHNARKYLSR